MRIHFLPARFGDCILIEYVDGPHNRRVLIDRGTAGTRHDIRKILRSSTAELELLVVTHIDRDHIEGILGLLAEGDPGFTTKDFWFNGWCHLPDVPEDETFGAVQGERLTQRIVDLDLPWNKKFLGAAVMIDDQLPLPEIELEGGLKLTLLGPTADKLALLKNVWEEEVREANLDPGFGLEPNDEEEESDESFDAVDLPDVPALAAEPFEEDTSAANGSSIAFLAEYKGKRLLFSGDAHPTALLAALERLSPGQPLTLDLFKLPHHGSSHNINAKLIQKVRCPYFVFSTNGSIYDHPDRAAVARVITHAREPELIFNYRSPDNLIWETGLLQRRHRYKARYPAAGKKGIVIEL